MATQPVRLGKLVAAESALFVCDIQERFREVIFGFDSVVDTARRMVCAAKELQLPVVATEQYPKALGHTVAELTDLGVHMTVVEKTDFSMCVDGVLARLREVPSVKQILLVGIEAHVCVTQTTLDLLEQGYEVHVLVDGVSSQRPVDRAIALQRLAQSGAFLATSEMAMFQLTKHAKHPAFKAISALAKEHRPPALSLHTSSL